MLGQHRQMLEVSATDSTVTQFRVPPGTNGDVKAIAMTVDLWDQFERAEQLTVTIEAGDKITTPDRPVDVLAQVLNGLVIPAVDRQAAEDLLAAHIGI